MLVPEVAVLCDRGPTRAVCRLRDPSIGRAVASDSSPSRQQVPASSGAEDTDPAEAHSPITVSTPRAVLGKQLGRSRTHRLDHRRVASIVTICGRPTAPPQLTGHGARERCMSLLGMPPRIPLLRQVYRMHPALYDPSDSTGHPVLVVAVDIALRNAEIVTRTSTWEAKGRIGIAHPPQADLGFDRPGWWRMHRPHTVPFQVFLDRDATLLGLIDERTWEHVRSALTGGRDTR